MEKTVKVVMLATEKASNIYKDGYNELHLFSTYDTLQSHKQHLYLISDDEIKEGDWAIHPSKGVYQAIRELDELSGSKKIIATTDTSLHCPLPKDADLAMGTSFIYDKREGYDEYRMLVPQIPESFIWVYIKAYNEGKPITEVAVEIIDVGEEGWHGSNKDGEPVWNEKLIVKTSNNEVIICPQKMYTRGEVIALCNNAFLAGVSWYEGASKKAPNREQWISDNLK